MLQEIKDRDKNRLVTKLNLKETFDAISISLSKDGILVIEDPYIGTVIKLNSYDQFYDEHVYVFSLFVIGDF